MFTLLFALVGCPASPGHATTTYEACLAWAQGICDCGGKTCASNDDKCTCQEFQEGMCDAHDPAYCDTQDNKFDAETCQQVHDYDTQGRMDWYNCEAAVSSEECNGDDAECGTMSM